MEFKKIDFISNDPIKNHNWNEPKDNNPNGFKLFMKSAFIGPPRSGKTLSAINLTKYLQDNNLIKEIFLLSPSIENNPFHILDIEESHKFYDLDNVENDLQLIINYMKDKVNRWRDIKENMTKKEYNKHYQKILKLYRYHLKKLKKDNFNELIRFDNDNKDDELNLTDEDYEILGDNKLKDIPFFYTEGPSFLIILDDVLGSKIISNKKKNPLNTLIANHRHLRANIFIFIQSFTNGIPRNIRRILAHYFLFKFTDNRNTKFL